MINFTNEQEWKKHHLPSKKHISNLLELVKQEIAVSEQINFIINIYFANNKIIQEYNNKFRNKNKPTNVLSFGQISNKHQLQSVFKNTQVFYLGEIVLSFETIKKEAFEMKKPFKKHLNHMIVHAILHLFGYDHIQDEEAEEMEAIEQKVLKNV
ncbi:MAG: hypothetical protein RL208_525 [Pseudomonadota bacterium]|jgi:probable rRNA maturation factor